MINPNWSRWVFASVTYFFDQRKQSRMMFIEGQERQTQDQQDYFELRLDGPDFLELSRSYFQVTIFVNILTVTVRDPTDFHKHERDLGIGTAAFETNIPVYKFGDDSTALLGCLVLQREVDVQRFGQQDPNVQVLESTIQGTYRMHIEE